MKKQVISAMCAIAATSALAQEASPWSFRVGATQITPHVNSGELSAPSWQGTQADIGSSTQLSGGVNYKLNARWAVDVPLGLPFEHELRGAGAIQGVGKLGTVKALPITVLFQYQWSPENTTFQPYAGAGITYAKFYGETGTAVLTGLTGGTPSNPTTPSIQSKWAPSFQIGVRYTLTDIWHLDVNYIKTYFDTKNTLSTGQTLNATVNPSAISIGMGRSFK